MPKDPINPITPGGRGGQSARIRLTTHVDPLGVKIARTYFLTFPKHAQNTKDFLAYDRFYTVRHFVPPLRVTVVRNPCM